MKKLIAVAAIALATGRLPGAKLCRKAINDTTYTIGDATFVVNRHNFQLTAPGDAFVFCENNYTLLNTTSNADNIPRIPKSGESWTFSGNALWGTTCYGDAGNISFRYFWRDVGPFDGLWIDVR